MGQLLGRDRLGHDPQQLDPPGKLVLRPPVASARIVARGSWGEASNNCNTWPSSSWSVSSAAADAVTR